MCAPISKKMRTVAPSNRRISAARRHRGVYEADSPIPPSAAEIASAVSLVSDAGYRRNARLVTDINPKLNAFTMSLPSVQHSATVDQVMAAGLDIKPRWPVHFAVKNLFDVEGCRRAPVQRSIASVPAARCHADRRVNLPAPCSLARSTWAGCATISPARITTSRNPHDSAADGGS